jgi:hypothetical protein
LWHAFCICKLSNNVHIPLLSSSAALADCSIRCSREP